jgi:hypothetical protein
MGHLDADPADACVGDSHYALTTDQGNPVSPFAQAPPEPDSSALQRQRASTLLHFIDFPE